MANELKRLNEILVNYEFSFNKIRVELAGGLDVYLEN